MPITNIYEWLWGQLSYLLPLLIGSALVIRQIPRRENWLMRVILSCTSVISLKLGLDWLINRYIPFGTPWMLINLTFVVVLYLLLAGLTTWCFECDWYAGLFCVTIGYSLQHVSYRLYLIYTYAVGAEHSVITQGIVLTILTALTYALIYYTLLRRLRFCTVIVDNKLQIVISTLFIMAVIFLDRFAINDAATDAQRYPIVLLSLVTGILGILLEMTNMSSRNMELQRDIAARLNADEKEKFKTDSTIVDLLNIKVHDLKHQLAGANQTLPEETVREIREVIDTYDNMVDTGCKALDAILMHKVYRAEQQGIKTTILVNGEQLSFMKDIDIYSLFGNILDNAIDAVKDLEQPDKRAINLSVTAKDYFLSINASNYFSGPINLVDGLPKTTKQDRLNHGFGMRSIQLLTEKYHGDLSISVKDDIFTLDIMFPL